MSSSSLNKTCKFLNIFKRSSLKPKDLLADPFRVFELSKGDCEQYKILHRDGFVSLVTSKSLLESQFDAWFEVWFKRDDNTVLSLFRSQQWKEIEMVYNDVKPIINTIMKHYNSKGISFTSNLLKHIVENVMKHPQWKATHFASLMNLYNLFTLENEEIIKNINEQSKPEHFTALHIAVKFENINTVKAILSLRTKNDLASDMSLRDSQGNSVLHLASVANVEILKLILDAITAFSNEKRFAALDSINKLGFNPLQMACYKEKAANVKLFFKLGLPLPLMVITRTYKYAGSLSMKDRDAISFVRLNSEILDDFDESEIKFGGTPMHWVRERKSIESLVKLGLPIKVRNINGETSLHVAVRNHHIKNYIYLLCINDKLKNYKDKDGNTPLHNAVSSLDVTAVQTLIIFEANLDFKNNLQQTPRHLAASCGDTESMNILHLLHLVGAKRCADLTDLVCYDGCSHDGFFDGLPLENWPIFEKETLYDEFYQSIVEKAVKKATNSNDKFAKMICFDGGGVKGVFAVQMLIELQKMFKKPLKECFNWVSGTSAGSVLAALLSLGMSLQEMRSQVILHFKDEVIKSDKTFDYDAAKIFLKRAIGENVKMFDMKGLKLTIFACLADQTPFRLHLFRNYQSAEQIRMKLRSDQTPNEEVWKACLASGTVPFQNSLAAKSQYFDGGIVANNPTVDTLSEFTRRNIALQESGRIEEIEKLKIVVSLGTGKQPSRAFQFQKHRFNILGEYNEFAHLFLQQITNPNWHVVQRAESWCFSLGVPFFRINPPFNEIISAFEIDDSQIINGLFITKAYMHAIASQLKILQKLLE
ncbi:85/88 kDa calcium-independent phospholipase A2-like protein [Dinothrombium tinctorium]|uniref:phospholipase A2 n=1 Tax=Dinothrombium tinctorium TaxID=1965070 RepID=A0A443R3P9_9ACAR|nr:85/88 kDa calcium-independent phospholipase A2-like protein [Dinothrombium tinctorium]